MLLNHHFWASVYICWFTVYGDTPPSACILMFWLTQDLLGTSYCKERCSPSEQVDKICSRAKVSLGLAFRSFEH